MITHAGQAYIRLIFCAILILVLSAYASAEDITGAVVKRVLDGDTLVLSNGERIRLLGLDAPEKGEALSKRARDRLYDLTMGRNINLNTCPEKDHYGRTLAVVRTGGITVNISLLEEGLALPMLIPPCGKMVASGVQEAAGRAMEAGKGIYSLEDYQVVSQEKAGEYIGKRAVIRGKILALHKGRKAWHFNFGKDWKTDFTAVLFERGRLRFEALGVNPEALVGREVLVIGEVKSYNGPEIILNGPDQLIPVQ